MAKLKRDLTGTQFGQLTVNGRVKPRVFGGRPRTTWECYCNVCGSLCLKHSDLLVLNKTTSCGCDVGKKISTTNADFYNEKRKYKGITAFKRVYKNYINRAKQLNKMFSIPEDMFKTLTQSECFYCGVKPNQQAKANGKYNEYVHNGLDRVDNSLGYTPDNVVPCCGNCNMMKRSSHINDFITKIFKIHEHLTREK